MNVNVKRFLLGVSLITSFSAPPTGANECKVLPSCADYGYTQTSCPANGSVALRCPYDTTKVACVGGYSPKCNVGDIYYIDDTCYPRVIPSKIPIGIVFDSTHRLVMSLKDDRGRSKKWANQHDDGTYPTSTEINVSTLTDYSDEASAKMDMNGQANTDAILAYTATSGIAYPAAQYCHDLTTGGKTWYLPALGEMVSWLDNKEILSKSGYLASRHFELESGIGLSLSSSDGWTEYMNRGSYYSSTESYSTQKWGIAPGASSTFTKMGWSGPFDVWCIFAY